MVFFCVIAEVRRCGYHAWIFAEELFYSEKKDWPDYEPIKEIFKANKKKSRCTHPQKCFYRISNLSR
jgi:hypothetical protein